HLEHVRRYRGLLGHQSLLSTLTYFDAAGRACVHVYSVEADKVNTWGCADTDRADPDVFSRARTGQPYFGSVTFNQRDSRPHMTVAIAEHEPGGGVIEADF